MNHITGYTCINCLELKENCTCDKDPVKHPSHYTDVVPGIECIDVTQWFNFNKGNAIKYIWRSGKKDDEVQDLKKAIEYLQIEIKRIEKK